MCLAHVLNGKSNPPSTGTFVSRSINNVEEATMALIVQQPTTMVIVQTNTIRNQFNQLLQGYHNPPTTEKHELQWSNKTLRVGVIGSSVSKTKIGWPSVSQMDPWVHYLPYETIYIYIFDDIRILDVKFDNGYTQSFEVEGC